MQDDFSAFTPLFIIEGPLSDAKPQQKNLTNQVHGRYVSVQRTIDQPAGHTVNCVLEVIELIVWVTL